MTKKFRYAIITSLLAGSISAGGGVLVGDTMVKRAEVEMLYEQVKSELFVRYLKGEEFEWSEFQLFTDILDREAKMDRFKNIQGLKSKNLIKRLIQISYDK